MFNYLRLTCVTVFVYFLQSTPLCEAVRSGKLDMVKFLGEKGADGNMKDYLGVCM